ncbi:DUF2125 domain-containing protein [Azospirillum sp.]|uniref:DUF2125 domain-containing protein n=1 Tax=Azospirillum sp. TaxID=34012 RepID=UPI003D749AE0
MLLSKPLRKRLTIAASIIAAALLAAWCAAWWVVAGTVERGLHAWAEAQRAQGATVEYKDLKVGGFPLLVRASASDGRVAARGIDWRGPAIVAEAPLWDPARIELTLPGEQRLRLNPNAGPPVELAARHGGAGYVTMSSTGTPLEGRLTFPGAALAPELPGEPVFTAAGVELTLTQPPEPPADPQQTGLGATLTVTDMQLPGAPPAGLGSVVHRVAVALRVQGRPPQIQPEALAAWSQGGGTVAVDSAALHWGPLKLALNGTLALDKDLQPQAAMTAEVRGAAQALTALKDQLKPNEMNIARSVVGMLARPDEDGEPVIKAPVTIQYRGVFVGPLKVAAVPAIQW